MEIIRDINEMREKLKRIGNSSIGLIQTKGILHEGHTTMIRAARAENYLVVVVKLRDIDEGKYNQYHFEEEVKMASRAGADFFFIPDYNIIYPSGSITKVHIKNPLATRLAGSIKPDYYALKLNTTCILLNIIQPQRIYLSDKDPQLVYFTKKLLEDHHYYTKLQVVPRVYNELGLVLSTKYTRLKDDERIQVMGIYKILEKAQTAINKGLTSCRKLKWHIENDMNNLYLCKLIYVEIVEVERFTTIETVLGKAYIMIGIQVGKEYITDYIEVEYSN